MPEGLAARSHHESRSNLGLGLANPNPNPNPNHQNQVSGRGTTIAALSRRRPAVVAMAAARRLMGRLSTYRWLRRNYCAYSRRSCGREPMRSSTLQPADGSPRRSAEMRGALSSSTRCRARSTRLSDLFGMTILSPVISTRPPRSAALSSMIVLMLLAVAAAASWCAALFTLRCSASAVRRSAYAMKVRYDVPPALGTSHMPSAPDHAHGSRPIGPPAVTSCRRHQRARAALMSMISSGWHI